jgi:hypothetical protein
MDLQHHTCCGRWAAITARWDLCGFYVNQPVLVVVAGQFPRCGALCWLHAKMSVQQLTRLLCAEARPWSRHGERSNDQQACEKLRSYKR